MEEGLMAKLRRIKDGGAVQRRGRASADLQERSGSGNGGGEVREAAGASGRSRGIMIIGRKLFIKPQEARGVWGQLAPLFSQGSVQEVFIRGNSIYATLGDERYEVIVRKFDARRFINRLAIRSGARLSYRDPESEAELDGWRLYFKLPLVSREWELTATRLTEVPRLDSIVHPLLAARLTIASLKPSVAVIVGPAGSGKTTLLNSLLNSIVGSYPSLRISIVEQVREIRAPKGIISMSVAGMRDVTTLLRQAVRYERPDVLVLGELRSEEIWSWIEAGRLGIAAITTYHAPSLGRAIESMASLFKQGVELEASDVVKLIDMFIVCRKSVSASGKIERGLVEAYLTHRGRLVPLYLDGLHLDEETFTRLMPERILVGSFAREYGRIRPAAVAAEYRKFEHIEIGELV